MIKREVGDLLAIEEGIIVQGCNCKGVMGSGLAKSIRDKWPDVYRAYLRKHSESWLALGDIIAVSGEAYKNLGVEVGCRFFSDKLPPRLIVVNAMTQNSYGRDKGTIYVDYDAIAAAFAHIKILSRTTNLAVNIPLIGCGLANGQWSIVENVIENAMGELADRVTLWVQE